MSPHVTVIGLVVADMARSLDFYRRLGLDIPAGAESAPHVEVELGGGIRLALDTETVIRSFDPAWSPGAGSPRSSIAFLCESPSEVDRLYAEVAAAGPFGHLAPWDAVWQQRYATLHDPDGNVVDLYAPLPGGPS